MGVKGFIIKITLGKPLYLSDFHFFSCVMRRLNGVISTAYSSLSNYNY